MKLLLILSTFISVYWTVSTKYTPAKVQVYSRGPGEFGKANILICSVSNFHPPDISIQLFQDGKELLDAQQTDLAFKQDWHFHLTRSAPFTPQQGQNITCMVTHRMVPKHYAWEPNM